MGILTMENLTALWQPQPGSSHARSLAPFLAVHTAYGGRDGDSAWNWRHSAVHDCVGAAWSMTGRWQARRAVTVSRDRFERVAIDVVPRLAKTLNTLGISRLADVAELQPTAYRRVMVAIQAAVRDLSAIRPTTGLEPVFGSKVLHHFFPSVVPVYDRQYIRYGALRLPEYQAFLERATEGWLVRSIEMDAAEPRMREYHRYVAFCACEVSAAPRAVLSKLRRQLGEPFTHLAPRRLAADRSTIIWHLDAKVVEYCLVGRAATMGLIGSTKQRTFDGA